MEALILIVPALFIFGSLALTAYGIKKLKDERESDGAPRGPREEQNEKKPKDRLVITCEQCQRKLRVPKTSGKLKVTCPSCKHSFAHEA